MNYLNLAISHLWLVFKEKTTGENNHKLPSLRTAPILGQDVKGLALHQSLPLVVASKPPFVLSPLDSVHMSIETSISNREDMQISESQFSRLSALCSFYAHRWELMIIILIVGKITCEKWDILFIIIKE